MKKTNQKFVLKKRNPRSPNRLENLNLPLPRSLGKIALITYQRQKEEELNKKFASVKRILSLLGTGAALAAVALAPGTGRLFWEWKKERKEKEWAKFKEFNPSYLQRSLQRLEKQRLVEKRKAGKRIIFRITEGGKRRILKYALEDLSLQKPTVWDGKWYLVSYDVPQGLSFLRDYLRGSLKRLGFYPLHESVYLHAYPCKSEVDFLREYFGVAANVRIFTISQIENDKIFREYFGV